MSSPSSSTTLPLIVCLACPLTILTIVFLLYRYYWSDWMGRASAAAATAGTAPGTGTANRSRTRHPSCTHTNQGKKNNGHDIVDGNGNNHHQKIRNHHRCNNEHHHYHPNPLHFNNYHWCSEDVEASADVAVEAAARCGCATCVGLPEA